MVTSLLVLASLLLDWQALVRAKVEASDFPAAIKIVEQRLEDDPYDYEAAGWHARLEAWSGNWKQAEAEYLRQLERVPGDFDLTLGLVDVRIWQRHIPEARAALATLLPGFASHPEIRARQERLSLRGEESHCEMRIGYTAESFSFAGTANAGRLMLRCANWQVEMDSRSRFGEFAQRLGAGVTFRRGRHGFHAAAARSSHSLVFPLTEGEVGYGLGLPHVELGYTHRWLDFEHAFVQVANPAVTLYLPRQADFTISLFVSGTVSGLARLGFPLRKKVRVFGIFAVGAENFQDLTFDRTGRFSARTFGGGLRWEIRPGWTLEPAASRRLRNGGLRETAVSVGYSFRF